MLAALVLVAVPALPVPVLPLPAAVSAPAVVALKVVAALPAVVAVPLVITWEERGEVRRGTLLVQLSIRSRVHSTAEPTLTNNLSPLTLTPSRG